MTRQDIKIRMAILKKHCK